jgi:hypothetical protein
MPIFCPNMSLTDQEDRFLSAETHFPSQEALITGNIHTFEATDGRSVRRHIPRKVNT